MDDPKLETGLSRAAGQPVASRGSLYRAIRDKCWDCMGGENAIKRIGQCEAQACALWRWRPYQG